MFKTKKKTSTLHKRDPIDQPKKKSHLDYLYKFIMSKSSKRKQYKYYNKLIYVCMVIKRTLYTHNCSFSKLILIYIYVYLLFLIICFMMFEFNARLYFLTCHISPIWNRIICCSIKILSSPDQSINVRQQL